MLAKALRTALDHRGCDLIVLTGGVSAGVADFVPEVLADCGVGKDFHRVAIKPGQPIWFGKHAPTGVLVFGLPGNPVSVAACYEVFVNTALRARCGLPDPLPKKIAGQLANDFSYSTKRPTYYPARLDPLGNRVTPTGWFGSAYSRCLAAANAFLFIPVGDQVWKAGLPVEVLPLGSR